MHIARKVGIVLLVALIIIQFFHPARNSSSQLLATDITAVAAVPVNVQQVLSRACYDCHSNNTRYPWYMNIQPVAWYLAHHITEGKKEINFSEFGSYSHKKQVHKLQEMVNELKEGDMPLSSYTLIHGDAKLSEADKTLLINWADSVAVKL